MTIDNETDGYNLYKKGEEKDLSWFHEQWKRWPTRVNPNNTINLSFLYGGILAYRELHEKDPELSNDLSSNIVYCDKYKKGR